MSRELRPKGPGRQIFAVDVLRDWVKLLFRSVGVATDNAGLLADSLVEAKLWGHRSHGVIRAPWYFDRMLSGAIDIKARPTVVLGQAWPSSC